MTDISALVDNSWIGDGEYINIQSNPLSADSKNIQIPAPEARGVWVGMAAIPGHLMEENVNKHEALSFIKQYFHALFVEHNLEAIDVYLDEEYADDDIGGHSADQKQNAKEYLSNLFKAKPAMGVDVADVSFHNGVISAFLEWFDKTDGIKHTFQKGVAIFVLRNNKILRRHTFIYYNEESR